MRPLIGISTYNDLAQWRDWNSPAALIPQTYVDAVRRSGGRPVLLPVGGDPAEAAATVADLDGLIVSGGGDVDPARYGARAHPETGAPNSDRDGWELALLDAALAAGRPLLAICRGIQLLNVLRGGTLHQHLPQVVGNEEHSGPDCGFGRHLVRVGTEGTLGRLLSAGDGQHRSDLAGRADAPPPGGGPDRCWPGGHGVGGRRDGRGPGGRGRAGRLCGRRAVAPGGGRRPAAVRGPGGCGGWRGWSDGRGSGARGAGVARGRPSWAWLFRYRRSILGPLRSRNRRCNQPGGSAAVPEGSSAITDAVFRPVRTGNVFEETVERLLDGIRLGVHGDGDRLPPERELAARLGVSRVTIRDALRELATAGYVQTRRGRFGGTFVTYQPDPIPQNELTRAARGMGGLLTDALTFRRVVEAGAAETAARATLSQRQREELTASLAAVAGADLAGYRQADTRLHLAVAEAAGSPLLTTSVVEVRVHLVDLLNAIPMLERNLVHSNLQHTAIVGAILAGDPDQARQAMEEHVEGTAALLRGFLGGAGDTGDTGDGEPGKADDGEPGKSDLDSLRP